MKKLLLLLAVLGISCASINPAVNLQRKQLARDWYASHNLPEPVEITCPSKKWGTPFCDVSKDGEIVFWLGCHVDQQRCFPLKDSK
jgi:hypothetical protein